MRRPLTALAAVLGILSAWPAAADVCATQFSHLTQTERLSSLRTVLREGGAVGFVNLTQGSYFIVDGHGEAFRITFFTSGLFDLYPIKREGPLSFCDNGRELRVIGLGNNDRLEIQEGRLVIGSGGPKMTFSPGAMPELLVKLHHYNERGLASTPKN